MRSSMKFAWYRPTVRPPTGFGMALAAAGLLASPAGLADFVGDKKSP